MYMPCYLPGQSRADQNFSEKNYGKGLQLGATVSQHMMQHEKVMKRMLTVP